MGRYDKYGEGFVSVHQGSQLKRLIIRNSLKKSLTAKENTDLIMAKRRSCKKQFYNLQEAKEMGAEVYAKLLQMNEDIKNLPQIDLDNPEEVRNRVKEYFDIMKQYKEKPTQAGLSLALGINRQKIRTIAENTSGKFNEEVSEEIRQVLVLYESLWESYMLNGDIPPQNGIFIGKNQFGYKDVVEQNQVVEVRPQIDTESIKAKYIGADNELPEDHKRKED